MKMIIQKEISGQFKVFSEKDSKKDPPLIDSFSQIHNLSETKKLLNAFQEFNDKFNDLLE
ncbi:MAG: hypothetical protein CM15mP40_11920 [Alphaproteobacteria bacterium]|nr:MAG: hypothetical protein CM15mP40_11920 [Alphaproteobacteria bacterium]